MNIKPKLLSMENLVQSKQDLEKELSEKKARIAEDQERVKSIKRVLKMLGTQEKKFEKILGQAQKGVAE